MQIVSLEATHLFDLNTATLGWLLAAVQPKKQHLRYSYVLPSAPYLCQARAAPLTNEHIIMRQAHDVLLPYNDVSQGMSR
jgi:hypothetical protein